MRPKVVARVMSKELLLLFISMSCCLSKSFFTKTIIFLFFLFIVLPMYFLKIKPAYEEY